MGVIHHVPLSVRDELFEIIGEHFAANIDPLYSIPDNLAYLHGNNMSKTEAGVDDQDAFRQPAFVIRSVHILITCRKSAEGNERGTRTATVGQEIVLFKHNLVVVLCHIRKIKDRFGQKER